MSGMVKVAQGSGGQLHCCGNLGTMETTTYMNGFIILRSIKVSFVINILQGNCLPHSLGSYNGIFLWLSW